MSKKDYIDAVNEIGVSGKTKEETINKVKATQTKRVYNKMYPIASLVLMCAIVMAIILPNRSIAPINEQEYSKDQETGQLPKVENFQNLYGMLKERTDYTNEYLVEDKMKEYLEESATNSKSVEQEISLEDYSKTNVQVEGVDEADIVKTDGRYIYYLANNKLTITDVSDNENLVSASTIEFENREFYPQEIFLKDNKIVVIGTEGRKVEKNVVQEERYYPSYKQYTVAKIYNVEDKTKPVEERTIEIEGDYLSARMIGDNVYLLANKYIYAYLCKEYKVNELDENYFKPEYIDTAVSEEAKCIGFDCIYYIPEFEDASYLNIAAFNITNNEPANIESYLGAGNEIYASNTNLYITKVKYNYEDNSNKNEINTEIYKFNLQDAKCTFIKIGTVPGSVLNQFSMDEKDGYFRIATTDSKSWREEDNTNNLYVLNENLEIVGKVEDLAPGEKIYSVRFMGNRAYMVTFVQTDPLFVIDLSDPTKPTVLGELKIPGYSKYLHPYDETHLIGIGEDTKVVNYGYGDQVTTDGMKISLFDVTDPNNPKEMYTEKIGEKGTYSELLYNHKALLFSKEKNILAFPISITGNNYNVDFQGAVVYKISLDKGFELKGKISNTATYYDKYHGENRLERIIYIKDTLFTLSRSLIKATDMNTMRTKGTIDL